MIIEINKHPIENSSNKNFGITFAIIFLLVSLYVYFYHKTINLHYFTILISFLLFIISFIFPKILKYPNFIWAKLGIYLGMLISPIILFLLFILVFTPIGIIWKVIRKDPLKKINHNKYESLWVKRKDNTNMENQF